MRLAIITAAAAALFATSAIAQTTPPAGPAPTVQGNGAFCIKMGPKSDCNFATMEACQKELKQKGEAAKDGTCINRSSAN
jgi:hypothetical protein